VANFFAALAAYLRQNHTTNNLKIGPITKKIALIINVINATGGLAKNNLNDIYY